MISPQSVSYLAPVDPGPSVSQAGAAAARAALSAAETSPEQVFRAVSAALSAACPAGGFPPATPTAPGPPAPR